MADDFFILLINNIRFLAGFSLYASAPHPHRWNEACAQFSGLEDSAFALFYSSPWRQAASSRASMRTFPQTAPIALF